MNKTHKLLIKYLGIGIGALLMSGVLIGIGYLLDPSNMGYVNWLGITGFCVGLIGLFVSLNDIEQKVDQMLKRRNTEHLRTETLVLYERIDVITANLSPSVSLELELKHLISLSSNLRSLLNSEQQDDWIVRMVSFQDFCLTAINVLINTPETINVQQIKTTMNDMSVYLRGQHSDLRNI